MTLKKTNNIQTKLTWKEQLRNGVKSLDDLYESSKFQFINKKTTDIYPIRITPHYLKRIDFNDPNDPLKKIVIPQNSELSYSGLDDTMGEQEDYKIKGLQHRYPSTALLIINNFCASYCRFCFRKRLFNPEKLEDESIDGIIDALNYIQKNDSITNVLFSGGDPFVSNTKRLEKILDHLAEMAHVQFVRIGTKTLAFLPQRIIEDSELVQILSKFNKIKPLYIIAHFDHPNEISPETKEAVNILLENGIQVFNQNVLLKNVNDDSETLKKLFTSLIESKIIPYYIHQAMPVIGSTHFQIPLNQGIEIFNRATMGLPGINKKLKFIIPHYLGKIEFLGKDSDYFYMKYHQSRFLERSGNLFKIKRDKKKVWFKEEEIIPLN